LRSTSKSAVSRAFVSRTRENLIELMSRPLEDLRLAILMLDGIELKGRCLVVALRIDTDGVKHPLGLWDGSTENATVATTLLANLVDRGLDVEQGELVVMDGAGAARGRSGRARRAHAGAAVPQRTQRARPPPRTRPADRAPAAARRMGARTTTRRSSSCARSPLSLSAHIRARPRRCAKGSRRRSRLPASGCVGTLSARSLRRTRASR
jgi:hypothetical protein